MSTTSIRPSTTGPTSRLPTASAIAGTGGGGIRRPSPIAPYFPHSDTATFRDLLLFEERLKMNAEMLRRRRRRYNAFLWTFILTLAWLLHRWLFTPPQNHMTMRAVQASLAVVVITLFLFFASGMYQEKIRYAHAYINHSNKALRPLNMHLNMRRPPPSFPIPFIRSSPSPTQTPNTATAPGSTHKALSHRRQSAGSTSTVMATIPPSSNPRGELIFSSRVDKSFREGYERYRAAFERRREEKAREEARRNARWFRRRGNVGLSVSGTGTPTPPASRRGTPPPSLRGRTPSPGVGSRLRNSIDMGRTSSTEGQGSEKDGQGVKEKRERAESYSFVWSREEGMPRRAP